MFSMRFRPYFYPLATLLLAAVSAAEQSPINVTLTRLDCGKTQTVNDLSAFTDVSGFQGLALQLTFSCYLIKHGNDYLLWDTGNPLAKGPGARPTSPDVSLTAQLSQLHVTPAQITFVGISHYHWDHIGQLPFFPDSTLLIGTGDWNALTSAKPAEMVEPANFAHWISGGGKVQTATGDKDVFGDGSVIMLNTPGHTPGHHSLLVKLKESGNILITGDLAHFRENYDSNGVPTFNTSRAETLASLDRFKKLAANLHATVIISHDVRDLGKLPAFPNFAK